MLTAGTYKVERIASCYLGESPEKKTPFFQLEFVLENGQSIDWVAWLSTRDEKSIAAANKHVETLSRLGYKSDKISDMADEKKSVEDLFGEPADEVNVVIEMETYENAAGETKERAKVQWVNVGFQSNLTKFDHKQAVTKFKSLPFDGTLKKLKAGEKLPPRQKSEQQQKAEQPALTGAGAGVGDEDVPF